VSDSEKTISVKLNVKRIERLDKLAKRAGISRHQLMVNMIDVGISEISMASKVGFFQVGLAIRDLLKLKQKPEPGEEKPLPLKLDLKLLAKIDKLAERASLSRHHLTRNLINVGIEEMETLSKIGVITVSVWLRDFGEAVKKIVKNGEAATNAVKDGNENSAEKGGDNYE